MKNKKKIRLHTIILMHWYATTCNALGLETDFELLWRFIKGGG